MIAPLSGEVTSVNEAVTENPDLVNRDPYGEGWLIRVRLDDVAAHGDLLDVEAYKALLPE